MIGFLRFLGIANAAVWFGAAVFFTFAVGPGIFSDEMRTALGTPSATFNFYAGAIALVIIRRYFILQYVCGLLALLHLIAERLYLGRNIGRYLLALWLVIFGLGLFGGLWLQPKMKSLRQTMYSAQAPPAQQEHARSSFAVWHGLSMTANLMVMIGLAAYLMRVSRPPESVRYATVYSIP